VESKPHLCGHVVPIEQEPRHHLVIENEFVHAFAVEIAPHDRTLCHHHAHDYLMYVACIADIISAPRDGDPETHLYKDEECVLAPAGMTHVVENLRDTNFRNVVLELLPRAGDLRRAGAPTPRGASGDSIMDAAGKIVSIRQRFDDVGRVAVYVLGMQSNAEVEICGPALVASPYEVMVGLEELGRSTVKLNDFKDLAWLSPLGKGLLRNNGVRSARAIVFQVGCRDEQLSPVHNLGQEPLKSLHTSADKPD
jgi:hypothetical protein